MIPYFNLVKYGLGGRQGSGNQMFSWVHITDLIKAAEFAFNHQEMVGVYNLSSPNPVKNKVLMQLLRKATGKSIGLPAYKWMLWLGAKLIGT